MVKTSHISLLIRLIDNPPRLTGAPASSPALVVRMPKAGEDAGAPLHFGKQPDKQAHQAVLRLSSQKQP